MVLSALAAFGVYDRCKASAQSRCYLMTHQYDIMISFTGEAGAMAQIIVRNIDEATKQALKERAKRLGRSMEAEVREILRDAVSQSEPERLGSRMAARFKDIGLDEPLPELRGSAARPAEWD